MYKSPLLVLLAVLATFLALNAMAVVCLVLGVSVLAVGIGSIALTLTACAAVAAKDPTYKVGYWYGFTFAAIAVGSSFNSTALVEALGFMVGALCPAAMWATYQIRKWRDIRRTQARFREFGL